MSIPLATTTVSILRPNPSADLDEIDDAPVVIATGIRGHFSSPDGQAQTTGGQESSTRLKFGLDICELKHTDLLRDDTTGTVYEVEWVERRIGLGLDHMEGYVRISRGAA